MESSSLIKGTPWKSILLFALPILAGNILQQLYNTVDTIAVGNFESEAALSAVGACAFLTGLYLAIAIGMSLGASVVAAQLYGSQDKKRLKICFSSSIVLLVSLGIFMTIFGLVTNRLWLTHIIQVPPSIYDNALLYMNIYVLGLIFQFAYNIIAALLKAIGDSKASLLFLLIASVVNIILDIVLIGGFHMSVAGAAIATNIAQLMSFIACIVYLNKRYPEYAIKIKEFHVEKEMMIKVIKTGIPMTIQQVIVSCGFMFMQRLVNSFGEAMTASFTVAMRIEFYILAPTSALQNAMATYGGQNYGAKRIDRIYLGIKQTIIMSLLVTGIICLLSFIFALPLINIFGIQGQAVAYCLQHLHTACFAIIFSLFGVISRSWPWYVCDNCSDYCIRVKNINCIYIEYCWSYFISSNLVM